MIQFNFQFKRKLSGFNSKKYSIRQKNQDSIQKNIKFKIEQKYSFKQLFIQIGKIISDIQGRNALVIF